MIEWKNAHTDPPKEAGSYLCWTRFGPNVLRYAPRLCDVDKINFEGIKRPGWAEYDSEYGWCETPSVMYWAEINPPKVEVDGDG